jgi:hypothetical protein
MYVGVLFVHSWLRYVVLGLGLLLLVSAVVTLRGGAWKASHERTHVAFLAALDTQLLLGLVLFLALSPIASAALADLARAMKLAELRFFGVEHPLTMLVAVVVAHVGRARSKRAAAPAKARTVLWTQLLWLLLTGIAIPWPGLDVGRPLWRAF